MCVGGVGWGEGRLVRQLQRQRRRQQQYVPQYQNTKRTHAPASVRSDRAFLGTRTCGAPLTSCGGTRAGVRSWSREDARVGEEGQCSAASDICQVTYLQCMYCVRGRGCHGDPRLTYFSGSKFTVVVSFVPSVMSTMVMELQDLTDKSAKMSCDVLSLSDRGCIVESLLIICYSLERRLTKNEIKVVEGVGSEEFRHRKRCICACICIDSSPL